MARGAARTTGAGRQQGARWRLLRWSGVWSHVCAFVFGGRRRPTWCLCHGRSARGVRARLARQRSEGSCAKHSARRTP
eukprot:7666007-Lingulodinium_polyedra.AAC.1